MTISDSYCNANFLRTITDTVKLNFTDNRTILFVGLQTTQYRPIAVNFNFNSRQYYCGMPNNTISSDSSELESPTILFVGLQTTQYRPITVNFNFRQYYFVGLQTTQYRPIAVNLNFRQYYCGIANNTISSDSSELESPTILCDCKQHNIVR